MFTKSPKSLRRTVVGPLENPGKEGAGKASPLLPWKGVPGSQNIYPEVEKVRGLWWTSDARVRSKVSGGFVWDFTNSCLPHSSRTPEVLQAFSDWPDHERHSPGWEKIPLFTWGKRLRHLQQKWMDKTIVGRGGGVDDVDGAQGLRKGRLKPGDHDFLLLLS